MNDFLRRWAVEFPFMMTIGLMGMAAAPDVTFDGTSARSPHAFTAPRDADPPPYGGHSALSPPPGAVWIGEEFINGVLFCVYETPTGLYREPCPGH